MIRTHLVKSLYRNLLGPEGGPDEAMGRPIPEVPDRNSRVMLSFSKGTYQSQPSRGSCG